MGAALGEITLGKWAKTSRSSGEWQARATSKSARSVLTARSSVQHLGPQAIAVRTGIAPAPNGAHSSICRAKDAGSSKRNGPMRSPPSPSPSPAPESVLITSHLRRARQRPAVGSLKGTAGEFPLPRCLSGPPRTFKPTAHPAAHTRHMRQTPPRNGLRPTHRAVDSPDIARSLMVVGLVARQ